MPTSERQLQIIVDAKDNASSKISNIGDKIGAAMKIAGVGIAAAGAAAGAFAIKSIKDFSDIGDAVEKMSSRTGLSAKAVSALRVAADGAGTSIETVEGAVRKLQITNINAATASDQLKQAFFDVGVSMDEIGAMNMDQKFQTLANVVGNVSDQTTQVQIATELFGKSGADLIPLFEEGTFSMDEWSKKAEELGVSFDDISAKKAADLNDAMGEMGQAMQGVALQVGGTLAPYITSFVNDVIVPALPKLQELASMGFDVIRTAVGFVIEKVKELWGWLQQSGVIDNVRDAFLTLWSVISTQLWPALLMLWNSIQPLMPFFEGLASLVAVLLYGAFMLFVNVLTLVLSAVSGLIAGAAAMEEAWLKKLQPAITFVTGTFNDFKNTVLSVMEGINSVVKAIERFIQKAKEAAKLGIGGVVSKVSGLFGGGSKEKKALGGPVHRGRTYLVGEEGPEYFTPYSAGSITPNGQIGGMGGGVNVSVNVGSVSSDIDIRRMAQIIGNEIIGTLQQNRLT